MTRFSIGTLLSIVVIINLLEWSTVASEIAHIEFKVKDGNEPLESRSGGQSYDEKNDNLINILPYLFLLNGAQYVQYSTVVMTMTAALGLLAIQGLLASPLHDHDSHNMKY